MRVILIDLWTIIHNLPCALSDTGEHYKTNCQGYEAKISDCSEIGKNRDECNPNGLAYVNCKTIPKPWIIILSLFVILLKLNYIETYLTYLIIDFLKHFIEFLLAIDTLTLSHLNTAYFVIQSLLSWLGNLIRKAKRHSS